MTRAFEAVGLLLMAAAWGSADQAGNAKSPPPRPRGAAAAPRAAGGAPRGGAPKAPLRLTNPGNLAARLYTANPEQRDRVLEKLPPVAQERARKQLAEFDKLPKEQRQMLVQRAERLASLPAERQREVVQSFQTFQRLPQDRKQAVRVALRRLQALSEEERTAMVNSSQFKNRFPPEEQKIVLDLSEIMLPPL